MKCVRSMVETTQKQALSVRVNGEERSVAPGSSIASMLRAMDIEPKKVAVERNLEIVPKSTFEEVHVSDGDMFEIVHFVGGG